MNSEEVRGVCYQTSTGDTVRVHDAICWRHLEGRPCRNAQERQIADAVDVVIIPVVPSGYGNRKRSRKGTSPLPSVAAAYAPAQSTHADCGTTGGVRSIDPSASEPFRDDLLRWCAVAQSALQSGGLRATVDDCPRQTPGAKYNTWENRGVVLRVEAGPREAASATFSLALHPRLVHLLPLAAAAAASSTPPAGPSAAHDAAGPAEASRASSSGGCGAGAAAGGRASLRLAGLSPEALVAACVAVKRAREAADAPADENGPVTSTAAAPATVTGSQWCRKLHLWPEVLAASGTTDAAVAALLAQLTAGAAAASTAAAAEPAADGGPSAASAAAGAAQVQSSSSNGGAGALLLGQRPCVAHLRHLLQLGRPCYCGRGHYSLQQLQQEMERCLLGSQGGAGQAHRREDVVGTTVTWLGLQPQEGRAGWQQAPPPPAAPPARGGSKSRTGRRGGASATPGGGREVEAEEGDPRNSGDVTRTGHHDGPNGGRADEDDGDDGDGEGCGHHGAQVQLLVGDIPPGIRAAAVQGELAAAFATFGCRGVHVSRTRNGGHHGWARVSLAGSGAEEAAAAAVAALDGKVRLAGCPLTVSYSSGRLDTIFPYLPYVVRSGLRVDSTAAFSATDQATADRMTGLLAGLAERLLLPPGPAVTAAAAARRPLLPLTITDATACCGGNTLSFARRFRRVVAVELDPDRADDLRHNAAMVGVWETFRSVGSGSSGCGRDAADGPGAPNDAPPTAAVQGSARGSALFSSLDVICGDYTQLAGSLQQDIVFMDPPWGGPQYRSSAAASPAPQAAAPAAPAPPEIPLSGAAKASTVYGDTVFTLGQQPLSYMVTELLVSGAAGMVALKLPSRGDAELRATQARVRQLVAAKLRDGAAGQRGDGVDCGDDGGGSKDCHDQSCCPHLLGAEVTLGRSALVVFMLLPYRRSTAAPCAAGPLPAGGEEAPEGGEREAGSAGEDAVVGAGVGSACGGAGAGGGDAEDVRPGDELGNCGRSSGDANTAAVPRRHLEGPLAAAVQAGCSAYPGPGPGPGLAFRAALKERCMKYGLPYRLVCE